MTACFAASCSTAVSNDAAVGIPFQLTKKLGLHGKGGLVFTCQTNQQEMGLENQHYSSACEDRHENNLLDVVAGGPRLKSYLGSSESRGQDVARSIVQCE